MKFIFVTVICLSVALWTGCATVTPADATAIQGTWKGQEVAAGQGSTSWLTLSGHDLEFHGALGEWYRGTYTLNENSDPKQMKVVITQAYQTQYVGKTANAIFRFIPGQDDHATLIITGNEPGDPHLPSGFADRRARQIVFSKD